MKKEEVPPHNFDFVSQGIPENRKQEDTQSLQKCKTEETVTVKPDSMYWKGQPNSNEILPKSGKASLRRKATSMPLRGFVNTLWRN